MVINNRVNNLLESIKEIIDIIDEVIEKKKKKPFGQAYSTELRRRGYFSALDDLKLEFEQRTKCEQYKMRLYTPEEILEELEQCEKDCLDGPGLHEQTEAILKRLKHVFTQDKLCE